MGFGDVSWLSILAATMAAMATGAAYYGALGRPWMMAAGLTEEIIKKNQSGAIYGVAALCQLVMALVLYGVIWHTTAGAMPLSGALVGALLVWLGFVVTTMTVNHRFQLKPVALTVIDAGHWLAVLLVQAIAISLLA